MELLPGSGRPSSLCTAEMAGKEKALENKTPRKKKEDAAGKIHEEISEIYRKLVALSQEMTHSSRDPDSIDEETEELVAQLVEKRRILKYLKKKKEPSIKATGIKRYGEKDVSLIRGCRDRSESQPSTSGKSCLCNTV